MLLAVIRRSQVGLPHHRERASHRGVNGHALELVILHRGLQQLTAEPLEGIGGDDVRPWRAHLTELADGHRRGK